MDGRRSLVALEMAFACWRKKAEKVVFVAMLDAVVIVLQPSLGFLWPRSLLIQRSISKEFAASSCEYMYAEALRQYRPQPWYGKILHRPPSHGAIRTPCLG